MQPISHAEGAPTRNWTGAITFITSNLNNSTMARQVIRRSTSPITMGRTPGRLCRAINLPATNASKWLRWISCVCMRIAIWERAVHKLLDAPLYPDSIRIHASESIPKSLAAKSLAAKSLAAKSLAAKSLAAKSLAAKSLAAKSLAARSLAAKSLAAKSLAAKSLAALGIHVTTLLFAGVIAWKRTAWGFGISFVRSTSFVGVVTGGCLSRSTSNTVLSQSPIDCCDPGTALGHWVRYLEAAPILPLYTSLENCVSLKNLSPDFCFRAGICH